MDPDSCWLVRTGQMILSTHSLPATDPFSFTIPMVSVTGMHQPFVVYQWLSEVVFAAVFNAFDLRGLLSLCSVTAAVASLAIIARACLSTMAKPVFCFFIVALAFGAVAIRLIVRPEIFTLLALSLWLLLLKPLMKTSIAAVDRSEPQELDSPSFSKKRCLLLVFLTIVWCNSHSGFVIGLLLLLGIALGSLLEQLVAKESRQKLVLAQTAKVAVFYLLWCLVASWINPYGIYLWTYLPHLFFSPFTPLLDELLPVSAALASQPIYYAFFLLAAASITVVLNVLPRVFSGKLCAAGVFRSAMLLLVALGLAVVCRRLVSPLSLIIAVECCRLFAARRPTATAEAEAVNSFTRLPRSFLFLELPVAVLSVSSVLFFADRLVPLTMPQTTDTFQPPFQAVSYLLDNWHQGNTFSTLQIASLLEMYGPRQMKQFADTRIDVYPPMVVRNYINLMSADSSCPELLRRYDIEWAVLTPHTNLGAYLANAPEWEKSYQDDTSLVFHRKTVVLPR